MSQKLINNLQSEIEENGHRWVIGGVAARELRISVSTVHRLADEGLLVDFFCNERRRYFSWDSIERLRRARRDPEFWKRERRRTVASVS